MGVYCGPPLFGQGTKVWRVFSILLRNRNKSFLKWKPRGNQGEVGIREVMNRKNRLLLKENLWVCSHLHSVPLFNETEYQNMRKNKFDGSYYSSHHFYFPLSVSLSDPLCTQHMILFQLANQSIQESEWSEMANINNFRQWVSDSRPWNFMEPPCDLLNRDKEPFIDGLMSKFTRTLFMFS